MIYKRLERVVVEFTNRDGVPTSLIVENPDPDLGYAEVVVAEDGLTADFMVYAPLEPREWRFKDRDDDQLTKEDAPASLWLAVGALVAGVAVGAALVTGWFVLLMATT